MVSRIRYSHVVNQSLATKTVTHLVWTVALLGMIYLCSFQVAMVILFGGFAASSLARWLCIIPRWQNPRPQDARIDNRQSACSWHRAAQ
jgi:hypothetical protein